MLLLCLQGRPWPAQPRLSGAPAAPGKATEGLPAAPHAVLTRRRLWLSAGENKRASGKTCKLWIPKPLTAVPRPDREAPALRLARQATSVHTHTGLWEHHPAPQGPRDVTCRSGSFLPATQ